MLIGRRLIITAFTATIAFGSELACVLAQDSIPVHRSGESTPPADSFSLGMAGNERILWVYQQSQSVASGGIVRIAYRTAEDPAVGRFWRGPMATGRVAQSTVRGADIHLFFSDGSHHRFAPVRIGTTPVIQPRAREIDFPDSALPVALGADQPRDWLFALVPTRVAQKIITLDRQEAEVQRQRQREAFGESQDDSEAPGNSNSGNKDLPAVDRPAEKAETASAHRFNGYELAVVRYEEGRWHFDRNAPADLTLRHDIPLLLAADAHVHLLYQTPGGSDEWHWRSSPGSDADWSEPVTVFSSGAAVDVAGGWIDDIPVVIVAERSETPGQGGISVRAFRADADLWSATFLNDDAGRPARFSDPVALSVFGEAIAVASINEIGHPQVSWHAPDTGRSTVNPTIVAPLIEPPTPHVSPGARQFLQYAVLAAVLMAVFVWRRERVLLIAPIKSDQAFARMDRRFAAFSLDLLILAPVWVPMLYALWRSGAPNLSASEQLVVRQDTQSGPLFWGGAMVGALFGLYGGLLELIMGQTFGKRIVGCRVMREDGDPCDAQSILLRNILRIVEFHFMALVLLVVFTPARQRLGDLLARTIVVEPRLGPPRSSDADPESDRDEDYYDNDEANPP